MTFRFAYRATVEIIEGDTRAIGGAVTVALCGRWDHEGPCRWPHLTTVDPSGRMLAVAVAYSCSDDERADVEASIERAVRSGELRGPDGARTTWRVVGPTVSESNGA